MKPIWRTHLIICLLLGVLVVPIYFFDLRSNQGGGSDWIKLDFRGLILWTYIALLAVHLVVSSIAVVSLPKLGALRIHFGSMVLSVILLVSGVFFYGEWRRQVASYQYQTFMKNRRPLINVIELKEWWYIPDDINPKEIRANVVVHQSGRFAGNVTGEQTDSSGFSKTIFQATNGPETQRQVASGEAFTYAFPLETLNSGQADDVRITLYLFKAPSGPAPGDIEKVFIKSPEQDDDGEYFYGVLPSPSRPLK